MRFTSAHLVNPIQFGRSYCIYYLLYLTTVFFLTSFSIVFSYPSVEEQSLSLLIVTARKDTLFVIPFIEMMSYGE